MNTIIGKITSFPLMKETISKSTRIVTFFSNSHYWGGQLNKLAQEHGITQKMKSYSETRWYSMIVQALSIETYRYALLNTMLFNILIHQLETV